MRRSRPGRTLRLLLGAGALALGIALWASPAAAQEGEDVRHSVSGVVTTSEGELDRRVWVAAHGHGDSPGEYRDQWTAPGGAFELELSPGGYRLEIYSGTYHHCIVSGLENPSGGWRAVFSVEERELTGVRVVVSSHGPREDARWTACRFEVPLHAIEGTLVGSDGEPLEAVSVSAAGDPFGPAATTPDGSFSLEVPDGSYVLELSVAGDGAACVLGYAGLDGAYYLSVFHSQPPDSRRIIVHGARVAGIDVRLPATQSALCRLVKGVALDAAGTPLEGAELRGTGRGAALGRNPSAEAEADGSFAFYVPDGTYALRIRTGAGSACAVGGSEHGRPWRPGELVVAGGDVAGLRLVVSGEPRADRAWLPCTLPRETAHDGAPAGVEPRRLDAGAGRRLGALRCRSGAHDRPRVGCGNAVAALGHAKRLRRAGNAVDAPARHGALALSRRLGPRAVDAPGRAGERPHLPLQGPKPGGLVRSRRRRPRGGPRLRGRRAGRCLRVAAGCRGVRQVPPRHALVRGCAAARPGRCALGRPLLREALAPARRRPPPGRAGDRDPRGEPSARSPGTPAACWGTSPSAEASSFRRSRSR